MNNALHEAKINEPKDVVELSKRIRIKVPSIYRNENRAKKLANFLLTLNGIKHSKANPITSKILIIFDERIISEFDIERSIKKHLLKTRKPIEEEEKNYNKSKTYKKNKKTRNKFLEEYSSAIAIKEKPNCECEKFKKNDDFLWHSLSSREIENILHTDYKNGLSKNSVENRIKESGLNILSEKKKKSLFKVVLENLNDFSNRLLLGVSGVSLFLGQIVDAAVVVGIVLLETTLGVIQQKKAEKSIYSLKKVMIDKAKVIRDGIEQEVNSKELVYGDVILLESGDKVPADARIIQCNNLKISEAELTGESTSVLKTVEKCNRNVELGDRYNMLFMGTNVLSGRARAVVVETGMRTEIGKIASMLQNIKNELTPLQKRLINFNSKLTKICIALCIAIGGAGLLMGKPLAQVLTLGVSFSVGALPESLPAIVTVAMGLSVQRLAKKNAIIRKLNAVETLGCANVICCDKTGTLTMNEMTVKKIYADNCVYGVSGSGYEPVGKIRLLQGDKEKNNKALEHTLMGSVLCNNALLKKKDNENWIMEGDPTEGVLITAAYKSNLNVSEVISSNKRIMEIPFDSEKKYMIVATEKDKKKTVYIKGALDKIINKCNKIYENGKERLFTATDKERIMKMCENMSDDSLRVLALAYKKVRGKNFDVKNNYIFTGLVGMEDPPRKGVKNAIKKCHKAGVKVVMITGDYKNTAAAIGRKLGLLDNDGIVVSGSELSNMTDEELDEKITKIQIFARTSPEQKLRIVKSFKRFGYVVAMTGDGVNDAPAIKEANIGIAMGNNGSEVAKDAADITLVDDNFLTIVNAIEEGRTVTNNIKNSIKYLLAGSLGEIIAIGAAALVSGTLPLLSIQILWTNVICETILGAGLAVESPDEKVMDKKPIRNDSKLIDRNLGGNILKRGCLIGAVSFASFALYNYLGFGLAKARTMAFSTLILTQLVNVYRCRNSRHITRNKYMSVSTVISAVLLLGILYIPGISGVFGTVPLNPLDWGVLSGMTVLSQI